MKLSTRYMARGIFRIARGTAKEITGKISSNTTMGIKGKFERITGKVQWKIGKAQSWLGV